MSNVVQIPLGEPSLSPELTAALDTRQFQRFGGSGADGLVIRSHVERPSARAIDEARRLLPALEAASEPMPREALLVECRKLLVTLAGAVSVTPDADTRGTRAVMLAAAVEGISAQAFGEGTVKAACRKFKFFPSVAEMVEFLEARTSEQRDLTASLRNISRSKPYEPPAPRRKPSAAEREAVSEALNRHREEKAAQMARDAALSKWGSWVPEGAESLSGDDLAAFLERVLDDVPEEGKEITAERIAMLKRASKMARMIEGRA
jgi:hypothetical protein